MAERITVIRGDIRRPARAEERRNQRHGQTGASQFRPYRNGLPEFRPYVYRGLGYDIYEEGEAC